MVRVRQCGGALGAGGPDAPQVQVGDGARGFAPEGVAPGPHPCDGVRTWLGVSLFRSAVHRPFRGQGCRRPRPVGGVSANATSKAGEGVLGYHRGAAQADLPYVLECHGLRTARVGGQGCWAVPPVAHPGAVSP